MWELVSARYTKQIKAGANAGLPTALSALISLYLGQALIATEEEIETFLSPLAPRSRIREVVHALLAARQLDTYTLEGRSLLHVAGAAPGFLSGSTQQSEPAANKPEPAEEIAAAESFHEEDTSRIKKFVPKPRKIGTGYLAKAKPAAFSTRPGGRPKFDRREQERGDRPRRTEQSDRERRPFQRTGPEDRERRPFGQSTPHEGRSEQRGRDRRDLQDRLKRPFTPPSDREGQFERRPGRREGEARPYKARPYERPRTEEQGPAERPTYRRFDEPRPKRGPKPFAQERRPRTFEAGKPPREGERRQNAPAGRPDRRESGERQRPRDRAASGERPDRRNFGERPERRDRPPSGERPNRRDFGEREGRGDDRPFANRGGKPSAKFGSKPGKFGSKPFGKKPRQKPGPPRKFRPREDESA
jgi:hypothetical protein